MSNRSVVFMELLKPVSFHIENEDNNDIRPVDRCYLCKVVLFYFFVHIKASFENNFNS